MYIPSLITRPEMISIVTSLLTSLKLSVNKNYTPPYDGRISSVATTTRADDKFLDNPTVFGEILRKTIPSHTYSESSTLYAFRDRTPRANLHALIIPKRWIETIRELIPSDLDLVTSMKEMALDVIRKEQPDAFKANDYELVFHVPPFNSVDHLHLHVLAPASEMSVWMRYGKYRVGTPWCVSVDYVLERLERGDCAMPNTLC
mmetsp:Transcript_40993/g.60187  ORF Transcript_40993/g.60187 Transcript_40993/m.60187 type:complete len:203 (+) Transcript_40993:51-659(+)